VRGGILSVVVIVVLAGLSIPRDARQRLLNLHWMPYVLPRTPASLWDHLHRKGGNGGIWHYREDVHAEIVRYVHDSHASYASLLDVACNLGFMLASFQRIRPRAAHYGTDVSPLMVTAARRRCPVCNATAAFDLASLALDSAVANDAGSCPLAHGLPASFDLVIVSDVLYYMPFASLPPIFSRVIPSVMLRASQKRLFDALTRLARQEVIFSTHQDNPMVIDFLEANGAVRKLAMSRRGVPLYVWTAAGRAPEFDMKAEEVEAHIKTISDNLQLVK